MSRVLSEAQVEAFYREGYIVVRRLVRPTTLDTVMAAAPTQYEAGGAWSPLVFDHDQPTQDAAIHRLLVEPAVVAAVEEIFECPARVYFGMLAVVPAGRGRGLPWHQDNMYSTIAGRALNVFMALCDIGPEKAGLWVSPRSHWQGLWPFHRSDAFDGHREADTPPDNAAALPALDAGDVCIFDRYMLHRSLTNDTAEHRYAYAAQYHEDTARMIDTGRKDPKRMKASDLAVQLIDD